MLEFIIPVILLFSVTLFFILLIWRVNPRKYVSSVTVASAYDSWTQDKLLERLWGDHIHLGFYPLDQKYIGIWSNPNFLYSL